MIFLYNSNFAYYLKYFGICVFNLITFVISGLASNLCKIAFNFLSLSPMSLVSANNLTDETYIVSQIRQHLSKQSKEKLDQFEILYNKISESVSILN